MAITNFWIDNIPNWHSILIVIATLVYNPYGLLWS